MAFTFIHKDKSHRFLGKLLSLNEPKIEFVIVIN